VLSRAGVGSGEEGGEGGGVEALGLARGGIVVLRSWMYWVFEAF
jgi:hypothetical protein